MEIFKTRLDELIHNYGIPKAKVAELLGISIRALHYYVSGERDPSLRMAWILADYFGVSIDYLAGRTDNPQLNF